MREEWKEEEWRKEGREKGWGKGLGRLLIAIDAGGVWGLRCHRCCDGLHHLELSCGSFSFFLRLCCCCC